MYYDDFLCAGIINVGQAKQMLNYPPEWCVSDFMWPGSLYVC